MQSSPDIPPCLGDVRLTPHNPHPIRLMICDEIEVRYDAWWGEEIGWGCRRTRKNMGYYQLPTSRLRGLPRIRIEPLTDKELALHRPDLPLRLHRHRSLNWIQLEAASPEVLAVKLFELGWDISALNSLSATAISLVCFGPTESAPIRHTKVQASHSGRISAADVLWEAGRLFRSQEMEADSGIGLYRMGIWGGCPAYSLLGYHNYSTWEHEERIEARLMPEWRMRRAAASGTYAERLKAMKRQFPFKQWRAGVEAGLDQYSKENCAAMAAIFDKLIKRLIALGDKAPEADKLASFQEAIEATNVLNEQEMNLIETGEREQLCDLCNEIARVAGLDPTKYGGGEGPASEWRNW